VYFWGFCLSAFLSELIYRGLTDQLDDEDDDGLLDDVLLWFVGSQLRAAAALVPVAGPLATLGVSKWTDAHWDDRLSTSPVVREIEQAARAPYAAYTVWRDGRVEKQDIRDLASLLGLLTGLPVAALARPLGYAADVAHDETAPTSTGDAVRGAVVGR